MNKLLLAGIAGAAAVAATTPAQAHDTYHYRGSCGFFTLSDGTDDAQTRWDGEIHAAVVATDAVTGAPAAVSITVECELRINGAATNPPNIVYSATGTGVAAGGKDWFFHADPDDVVTLCDIVTVGNDEHKDCGDATTTPLVPEPVRDALDDHVWPTVDPTIEDIDEAITDIEKEIDKIICPELEKNQTNDHPPEFDIRDGGDIYVFDELWWDCPPYNP